MASDMGNGDGGVGDVQLINAGDEDQMELHGYRKSAGRTAAVIIFSVLTLGLLALYFHWYPRYKLICTHVRCPLIEAEKVLIIDNYKGKYNTYFVEVVETLSGCVDNNNDGPKLNFYINDTFQELSSIRSFTCKRARYIWDDEKQNFTKLCGLEGGVLQSELHKSNGLGEKEQNLRRIVYGTNEIDVPIQSIPQLFILEALTPFYIFQVFSLIVWLCEEYYYYGIAIVIMSAYGIGSSIIQTRTNQTNLKGTVHMTDEVTIKRGEGRYETILTSLLVPGDVIVIPNDGCVMHCDAVLLNGNCVMNESMLTGESVPVIKTSLPNIDKPFFMAEAENYVLSCGTKVIQTRNHGDAKVLAVVLRTGFLTTKGQLVRSIMYPPPADFKFDQDSYKYIRILAVIATAGVIYTVVSKSTRNISVGDIIIKALDTITIIIPPALPAAMTVGKLYALGRLKKKDIFCINSRIINVTGSVNCICFDKTGTLTEDGLDMWGVVPVEHSILEDPVKDAAELPDDSRLLQGMVTCHSLTLIHNNIEGDPLDVKMFESTQWSLEEPESSRSQYFDIPVSTLVYQRNRRIAVLHQYQFSSNLQRMSVIVKNSEKNYYEVFCKGSPEMIMSLSKSETVPVDIVERLREHTMKGYRVIAMATKILQSTDFDAIKTIKRNEIENELEFLGLIVLENKLKPETQGTIQLLKEANMKVVMITGDNILTALSVAKECGIVETGGVIVEVEATEPTKNEDAKICFTISQNQTVYHMKQFVNTFDPELGKVERFHFAMTGNTWRIIREYFSSYVQMFVTRGTVFARMSSDQKQQLVEEFQGLGYYVSMCGDGTNDCGALRAAHVGISLSEAESSVASPFTSKTPNISCVPEIIKEGRAALSTSFGIFKFMIVYSLAEYTSVIILYGIDCNLSSLQFLYIDICLIVIFASVFGKTSAYKKKLHSKPPMTSLLSFIPVISILANILSVICFQTLAYYLIQTYDWFEPFEFIPDTNIYTSYENYAVFAVSLFQYISMAIVFSKGYPYRKRLYTNKLFTASLVIMTGICIYVVVNPAGWILDALEMKIPPEVNGKIMVLILGLAHFVLVYILEDFFVDFLLYKKIKPLFHNVEKSSKKYLMIEREFGNGTSMQFASKGIDNIAFECERTSC